MNQHQERGWEVRLEEECPLFVKYKDSTGTEIIDFDYMEPQLKGIKDFIRKVESEAYERGYKAGSMERL